MANVNLATTAATKKRIAEKCNQETGGRCVNNTFVRLAGHWLKGVKNLPTKTQTYRQCPQYRYY
jgi:hypothetical protein|tara:strand:- start:1144 stop:1335 length:192 start_codon:yes stop_codon:yes gene_type:complete